MKNILIILIILVSYKSFARCQFPDSTAKLTRNKYFHFKGKKTLKERLNNREQYWTIKHITHEYGRDMTIRSFVMNEINRYHNELNIYYFYSHLSKRDYAIVNSYPGENEYGMIFDIRTNRLVAMIGDGDIYCY